MAIKFTAVVLLASLGLNFASPDRAGAQADGFETLFDGRTINGWCGFDSVSPQQIMALSKVELHEARQRHETETKKHWTVENGELVNDGSGPYLTTERNFSDFELRLQYKTVAGADSGVYLKATPQVQIWDFTEAGGKWDIGAKLGSGGLWNNSPGAAGKDPLVAADLPFGQWNSLRVLQIGARTSVWLNDKPVVDHAVMENHWNRELPLAREGPIQLQTHGGEIRWRNIQLREIEADEANRILAGKHADGFESIFNSRDFSGWSGPVDHYQIEDGELMCRAGSGGTIYTEREYADFVVRLEFNLPPKGNNGLAIRYPGQGDGAYVGMCELQILASDYPGDLDPRQLHGSAYGMVAATPGYLRRNGQWNFQEVTVQGSRITVELNGSVILNTDLSKAKDFLADSPHPGRDRKSGHFGFAGHNDPVRFRNIKIKE